MSLRFVVYAGRDNVEELLIVEEDALLTDLSGLTAVQVVLGSTTIDSDAAPAGTIWWTDQKTVTQVMADEDPSGVLDDYVGQNADVLKLRLGNVSELESGVYQNCCLLLFDSGNPDGVVWDQRVQITVHSCE